MKPVLFFACAIVLSAQQGRNPDFYSIEKEIALGYQLAAILAHAIAHIGLRTAPGWQPVRS